MRLEAGVRHVLSCLTGEGHVYAPRELLAQHAAKLLAVPEGLTDAAISRAVADSSLVMDVIAPD